MIGRGPGHPCHDAAARSQPSDESASQAFRDGVAALTIAAVGIVYCDIGTSPLYALDQISLSHGGVPLTHENVLGGDSCMCCRFLNEPPRQSATDT